MTLYRSTILDVVGNPFRSDDPAGTLRAEDDGGLLVRDGVIVARGPYARLRADHPDEETEDLSGGLLLPGFVDTHVHYPQVRAIGGLGMPLLDWLDRCALPEEARLADQAYAMAVAEELMTCLVGAGTTTALVFGSHFATAVDALFAAAERTGLRITAGQVLSDRILRDDLLTTPARAVAEGRAAAGALARQGRAPLRRHPAVLAVGLGADAGRLRRAADRGRRRVVDQPHQRERGRGRPGRRALPRAVPLPRHLPPSRAGRQPDRAGPQRPSHRPRVGDDGGHRVLGRPLPDQQRCAGQRAVPLQAPRRVRRRCGPGIRCRCRHRVLPDQGGTAGLLRPAAPRTRRAAVDAGPPALPGHPGRRARARSR